MNMVVCLEEKKETKWLEDRSSAYVALEEVVLNKKILKDIEKLTEFHHTGELEVHHSLLLKYVPKRLHYSYKGMVAQTQLAVIDHNSNTGRKQATVTRGKKNEGNIKYKLVFPKGQKKWVAKPVKTRKSYSFVKDLMGAVFCFHLRLQKQMIETQLMMRTIPLLQPVFQKILHPYQGQVESRLLPPTKQGWEKNYEYQSVV